MFENYEDILIVGAGRSGVALARFIDGIGKRALLTDVKDLEKLKAEGFGIEETLDLPLVKTIFGRQVTADEIAGCDLLLLSPGASPDIPPCRIAREKGIRIASEIEYSNDFFEGKIIAITGTNGKTTTTTLTAELLSSAGFDSAPCGNIGDPFINYSQKGKDFVAALEISSFQLDMTEALHPRVAVITNITPDHLDRHLTMENYIAAKARVFENMGPGDFLIVNGDDPNTMNLKAPEGAETLFFTVKSPVREGASAWLDGDEIWVKLSGQDRFLIRRGEMKLLGVHNAANVMCAALAVLLAGADLESVQATLKEFVPVEHRVEFVREVNGVKYVNDSKGTNPEATMTAIEACRGEEITLLLGGYDKHSEFDELFELIAQAVTRVIVLGATKEKIMESAAKAGYSEITPVADYAEAIALAAKVTKGGYVLLSPACASWDMFANFEERGAYFKKLVNSL